MDQSVYDTIIIGGGPGGAGAAVYAARKKLKTLVITEEFGGQSMVSASIENWIGELKISGIDLAERMRKHVEAQGGVAIRSPEKVTKLAEGPNCVFEVSTGRGNLYRSKTVIITSGAKRRRLDVPGEEKLEGKGLAFCSTCDAPFYEGLPVAVVGSGNAALEAVIDLLRFAKEIHLLIRGDKPKGDPLNQEKAFSSPKVHLIESVEVEEILGDRNVTGLRYKTKKTGESKELPVSGVFVEIGLHPNSEFATGFVNTNEGGEIIVDHMTGRTSRAGVFAAGDVTDDLFKQNNIAAGDGVRAALSAYSYILNFNKYSPCAEKGE